MAERQPPRDPRSRPRSGSGSRSGSGKGLSRRQFLPRAAGLAALGAAGVAGYELRGSGSSAETQTTPPPQTTTTPSAAAPTSNVEVQSFVTRPDLKPPVLRVGDLTTAGATESSPRFIALAPINVNHDPNLQYGPMLVDRQGRVVWFNPIPKTSSFDFKVQSYKGQPVLAWWTGHIVASHGAGQVTIADSSYKTIKTIDGGDGMAADLHDLVLTSSGTALVTAYESATADLSSHGGSTKGKAWDCHVLEIDLASGKVIHDWDALKYVPIADSYKVLGKKQKAPFDYFHLNSVSEMEDGSLLISSRNTWGIYAVDRSSGKIIWQMGGKRSDFSFQNGAQFSWQHHTRQRSATTMTVFDNGMDTGNYSRGLLLNYNTSTRQVSLQQEYVYPSKFIATVLGSVQPLPDGRVFVGWGSQPYFSEYTADGTMISDGQFPLEMRSYRAYLVDWVGKPTDKPVVAARSNPAGGFAVYASWNGATEIASWTVLAGKSKSDLQPVGSQPWSGFETTIIVNSSGPVFAVVAVDKHGNELGRSEAA